MPSSPQESDFSCWTLQALGGKFNVRIANGLMIGEDEQGHFEIAPTEQKERGCRRTRGRGKREA